MPSRDDEGGSRFNYLQALVGEARKAGICHLSNKAMISVSFRCPVARKDLLLAELYEAGTAGVVEDDMPDGACRLRAFFADRAGALAAAAQFGEYAPEVVEEEERDWVRISRELWAPRLVGERFYLVPEWRDDPAPAGRIRLVMPPGTAAGTGLHPATQLALRGLEQVVRPGDRVLDVGTGSGILAAAAERIGAALVIGCDIDAEAVAAAREYLRGTSGALLYVGSTRSLVSGEMDVVVANLNATTVLELRAEIARVLKRGGSAILTGFPTGEVPRMRAALGPRMAVSRILEDSGWACLVARKEE